MNVLIFEDEPYTSKRLIQLLKMYDSGIRILKVIGSVEEGIHWFRNNPSPELIFQDILLNDGNCFEIFEQVNVQSPVIFTTAYDEFALKSFQLNSIDYLLKPYDFNDIKRALDKFRNFRDIFVLPDISGLRDFLVRTELEEKKRFLVKLGDRYYSVKTKEIAWFVYDEGLAFAVTFNNRRFPVNFSIDQLSQQLARDGFFQVNRKYIVSFECIKTIHSWFTSRFKLEITPRPAEDIIVSRERAKEFKIWLDR